MKTYGLMRVAAAVPVIKLADVSYNRDQICSLIDRAEAARASVLALPELCLTGSSCGDLFTQCTLLDAADAALDQIRMHTRGKLVTVILGAPVRYGNHLYNCGVVIRNGVIRGRVPKVQVAAAGETAQRRWFASGADFMSPVRTEGKGRELDPNCLFDIDGTLFAVDFSDDLDSPLSQASCQVSAGADVLVCLSAGQEVMFRHALRKEMLAAESRRLHAACIHCGAGQGESTQDLVSSGDLLVYEDGDLQAEGKRFSLQPEMVFADLDIQKLKTLRQKSSWQPVLPDGRGAAALADCYSSVHLGPAPETDFEKELYREINPRPFIPKESFTSDNKMECPEYEAIEIQVSGLASRLEHIRCQKAVIGISGGLDSTLALLVCVLAFDKMGWDRKGILGVTMPGFGTSGRTYRNALDFMEALGISRKEISIVPAVKQHFSDIGQDIDVHDVTYENSQARERTQILMDLANKEKAIVIGTGDLSELALGWATYNGDHMSMYGVNASVPKTLVRHLVTWIADHCFQDCQGAGRSAASILKDIVDTPVSPELTPASADGTIAQVTEDLVGPYELHDFYLYNYFKYGYGPEKIYFLARKAFDGQEGRPAYPAETIKKCLRTFYWRYFTQQFKRSCLPDGPKVTEVSLSPRGDHMMPSDAKLDLFLQELDRLD